MRKLLLLGGSSQQVKAIEAAKQQGYFTVLCDFLPDNPGQYVADKFYLVSTTDKEAILRVAQTEQIDGIVAYSSDPAAPTAAYVAEKMSLPGIPHKIAESFCAKNMFRQFLDDNMFNVPKSLEITDTSTVKDLSELQYPIILKPTDGSGSKGVTVIRCAEEFDAAQKYALDFARNHVAIAEEYIERDHADVIEAEIFVVDGKVAVWGLIGSVRDPYTNPLLPAAYSYPIYLSNERIEIVKKEISRLITCSNVKYGAFNMEMVIDSHDRLFFLDVGPRNGGNMLPEYIGGIMNEDLTKATVCAAMGDYDCLKTLKLDGNEGGYWGLVVLHTGKSGVLRGVSYSELAQQYLLREHFFVNQGEEVQPFIMSKNAVGLAFFKFPTKEIRDEILNDFEGAHIAVVLQ